MSYSDKFSKDIGKLKKSYPQLSFGYLGNLSSRFGDDRDWFVFAGATKWGGYRTKDLKEMWTAWKKQKKSFLKRLRNELSGLESDGET